MKVSISIVSYNTKDLLVKCLEKLYKSNSSYAFDVWVVDNNSFDGSADEVAKRFKQVNLIRNKNNDGFAKGHNIALKKINSDLILLLNPDTEFSTSDIDKMVAFMEEHPDCGIASCKIVGYDNNLHSNGGDLPFGLSLISWLFNLESFGIRTNFHRTDIEYYSIPHEVEWVGGTFMLIRKEVFASIGLLNEDYFMYFEDAEFCFKALKSGFKIMINPEVVIKHKSGASSQDPRYRQWLGELNGLLYFYNKHFGLFAKIVVKVLIYITITLRIIAFSLFGKFDIVKTYLKIIFKLS